MASTNRASQHAAGGDQSATTSTSPQQTASAAVTEDEKHAVHQAVLEGAAVLKGNVSKDIERLSLMYDAYEAEDPPRKPNCTLICNIKNASEGLVHITEARKSLTRIIEDHMIEATELCAEVDTIIANYILVRATKYYGHYTCDHSDQDECADATMASLGYSCRRV